MARINRREARIRRHRRVRKKVNGTSDRPRLNVFRSLSEIQVQLIDDQAMHTLVAASSNDHEIRKSVTGKTKTEKSEMVGKLLAERALAKGIKQVVFDRGGYKYIGRVKALAEAAREAGLEF